MTRRIRLPPPATPGPGSGDLPKLGRRRWRWSLYLAVWTLTGILFVDPSLARHVMERQAVPWSEIGWSFLGWYLWGLLLSLIWWWSRPHDKLRARELAASRLEGQLAQANLQMLKMQLHPHFLFNTLNAISSLMHRDVEAADRMIVRLSDLLRMALEKDDRHQVRLESELEFLHRYLAIEQIRFRDRLKVDIDVEPVCLSAQVPRLILQPLVENAIRHGIAMRSAAGRLAIRARRRGARLDLSVADDGPGLPPNRPLRPGVGLANTQARLAQLYGGDGSLELVDGEGGGFEVVVEIPFEEQPRPYGGS